MKVERFQDLGVWKEARELSRMVFAATSIPPFCVNFRLRDQILAASGSVMDNIAEGFSRDGNKEFMQFLSIAKGSCGETRSQLQRSLDFGFITEEQFRIMDSKTDTLMGQLSGFIKYLRACEQKGPKYDRVTER